jgi:deazaflavin-dependent oxidoreductase (nitroreductase family)
MRGESPRICDGHTPRIPDNGCKILTRERIMSDADSAAIIDVRKDWVSEHRDMYLKSGGSQGHIMDITPVGGFSLGAHCLLKYSGRKSGKLFITPLCYAIVSGEVVICASKGGADTHPQWYNNLVASPAVEFQIGTQAYRGTWREPQGAEREKVWAVMVDNFPFYANYKQSTTRVIPLVMMKLMEEIPVFTEADMTGVR